MFSNQIIELLDHCGVDHTGIVGFSLGGMVARKFAQLNPTKVSALAILHSPHKRSVDAQDAVSLRVRLAEKDGPTSTVDAALERWFTKDHRDAHPEQMELVRRWVLHTDPSIYHQNYRGLADGVDEIVAPDPAIVAPTCVMTADEDFGNGPDMAHAIAAEIIVAEHWFFPACDVWRQ